jgi:hypothetical protein
VAYHFHWPPDAVLNLEHAERLRWVQEISSINDRMNGGPNGGNATETDSGFRAR